MLSFGTERRAVAPPCLSTRTRSDRHFPDLAGACARGRGVPSLTTNPLPPDPWMHASDGRTSGMRPPRSAREQHKTKSFWARVAANTEAVGLPLRSGRWGPNRVREGAGPVTSAHDVHSKAVVSVFRPVGGGGGHCSIWGCNSPPPPPTSLRPTFSSNSRPASRVAGRSAPKALEGR